MSTSRQTGKAVRQKGDAAEIVHLLFTVGDWDGAKYVPYCHSAMWSAIGLR